VSETAHGGPLAHHFEDLEQQHETCSLGMWAFLAQEVMFFGGLFATYLVYRHMYPEAYFEGSSHLDVALGTFNTAVLIGSSLTMALAVRAAQLGRRGGTAGFIVLTMLLGLVFLGVKAVEYQHKFHDGLIPGVAWHPTTQTPEGSNVFFALYFVMTGMHALHMVIGLVIMVFVALRALRGHYSPQNYVGVEILGLYWHFVDLVWIFLFPLLYLLSRHTPGVH
jgi:cytochrome c oxidase subunit 3